MAQPARPAKGETVIVATGGVIDPPASVAVRNDGGVELVGSDLSLNGDPLVAIPAGGTTGQVLTKVSDEDFDVEWADPA